MPRHLHRLSARTVSTLTIIRPVRGTRCSRPAFDIVDAVRTGIHIFPGQRRGAPLSIMALAMVLRRMKVEGVTVHGFRSSFRDWAAEETTFAREVAEAALAHVVGDATERAYRRGDALERRRALMEAWEEFCGSGYLKVHIPS